MAVFIATFSIYLLVVLAADAPQDESGPSAFGTAVVQAPVAYPLAAAAESANLNPAMLCCLNCRRCCGALHSWVVHLQHSGPVLSVGAVVLPLLPRRVRADHK